MGDSSRVLESRAERHDEVAQARGHYLQRQPEIEVVHVEPQRLGENRTLIRGQPTQPLGAALIEGRLVEAVVVGSWSPRGGDLHEGEGPDPWAS